MRKGTSVFITTYVGNEHDMMPLVAQGWMSLSGLAPSVCQHIRTFPWEAMACFLER